MIDREKVINGLECCDNDDCDNCPYFRSDDENDLGTCKATLHRDAISLLKALSAFKEYFDGLYGQGLDVANYHLNGVTEPFDSFYDSAMEEYENAKCADTQRDYEAAVEMAEYCERYEPTYDPETGAM